jgi:hypothetical protein
MHRAPEPDRANAVTIATVASTSGATPAFTISTSAALAASALAGPSSLWRSFAIKGSHADLVEEDKDVEEVSRNEETPPLFGANSQIEKTGTAKRSTTTWFKSLRFPSLFTAGGILYFCLAEQN